MQRMAIRTIAIFVLVLAAIGGAFVGIARQQQLRTEATNRALAAQTARLQAERQRAGEMERASRDMLRLAQSDAKVKADAASRAAALQAKVVASQTSASPSPSKSSASATPSGPIPASCAAYSGNVAIGCAELLKFGFPISEMPCLRDIWMKESGWNPHASNPSGA